MSDRSRTWNPAKSDISEGVWNLSLDELGPATRAVRSHLDRSVEPPTEPLTMPIYHSSTYRVNKIKEYEDAVAKGGHFYARIGNPTVSAAECAVNALEGGAGSLLFTSGSTAALAVALTFLKAGDHAIICNPLYSGVHKMFKNYIPGYGIEVSWSPNDSVDGFRKLVKSNTKLMFAEVPCNPTLTMLDIEEFAKLGHSTGAITVIDATFASPIILQPMRYGIDIALHSCSKYMGGHTDLIGGSLTTRTKEQWQQLKQWQMVMGTHLSPFDASLLHRGLKTLSARMSVHSRNAAGLAKLLEEHPKVERVYYPGLESHPQKHIARKLMKNGFGGMIAFEVKGGYDVAKKLAESVKIINLAVSLGGTESLIEHVASMTHGPLYMTSEARAECGIKDGLIRLSVGIEDEEDLKLDLTKALENL